MNHRLAWPIMALMTTTAFSAVAQTAATTKAPRNRADIPAQFRWDFSPIYPNWDAWEAGMRDMEAKTDAFAALKGTLGKGPDAVLKAYLAFDEIGKLQYRLFRYPQLQRDVDTRDQAVAGRFQRVGALFAKFDTATAWFTPEMLTVPQATMQRWLDETPALKPYRFPILEVYRRAAHTLDERGEHLLSLAGRFNGTPRETYSELSTSDIKFPTVEFSDGSSVTLSPGNYHALLERNRNQADRAKAAQAHLGAYATTAHTYAAVYNGVLQRDWFMTQARKFSTTLDAALDSDAVPRQVVETLIEATRAGAAPLQRYLRLRKKLLDLPTYHPYDGSLPLFESDQTYPYEAARDLVLASVAPLGEAYVSRYRRFMSGGRIDVYESPGKRSGAYSAGVYGVGPYQLLNYNDTLDSVFTLAHEGGHAMHTVLSYENQPFATADYTIFVAEVASTTNERFLLEELLRRTSEPKERFLLLQHAADAIVGTYYTQVMFADYELQAHRLVESGQPITTAVLRQLYADTTRAYYGDAMTLDPFYEDTWARISHFFASPYYVYQYATCFASSARLFDAMTRGTPESRAAATERYLTLLKSGGNDHPMSQLQQASVDLTQRATIQAVIDQLDALVTQMEAEAAKTR
ncbi:MAG TPA: oligoendopeptidase F [Burkholderiaceae bacterium]|nr:oligoendopeptidase F [Burkholderiaceae bacterium]